MLGAIAGDMIGSPYEANNHRSTEFPLFSQQSCFTDDTVLTVAIADAILSGGGYRDSVIAYARRFPHAGYGGTFRKWMWQDDPEPYNIWGNGSAMRVSPVGWAFDTVDEVLEQAKQSAQISHDHPEGIRGAQAIALAVLLARQGADKATLKSEISGRFGYDLDRRLDDIRPVYAFDVSCQGSVPEALIAVLESDSVEHAIRLAVSLGGDSDTLACMAGSVAEALHAGIDAEMDREVRRRLPPALTEVTNRFREHYCAQRTPER